MRTGSTFPLAKVTLIIEIYKYFARKNAKICFFMVHCKEPIGFYRKNRHVGLFVFCKKHIKNYWVGSYPTLLCRAPTPFHTLVISTKRSAWRNLCMQSSTLNVCSFLLTSEEKEPKKNATSKASFKGGCNRSYSSLFTPRYARTIKGPA